MNARDLVALASAHGVDLLAAARIKADEQRRELELQRQKSTDGKRSFDALVEPKSNGVKGKETRSFKRPRWSASELAQAATGMPAIEFDVLTYCYGGATDVYWTIWAALLDHARFLRVRHDWPAEVRDIHGISNDYLPHLCVMVLDEDLNEQLFKLADSRLCSIYMRVDHHVWTNDLQPRYELVKLKFIRWRDNALSTVQSRLNASAESA